MIENNATIQILYEGGSGGHFLAAFLTAAKTNDPSVVQLSRFGNAHQSKFFGCKAFHFGQWKDDDYTFLTNHKKKIIIIYDHDDIENLATIYAVKFGLDSCNYNLNTNFLKEYYSQKETLLYQINNYHQLKKQYHDTLFVTWKELYNNDANILISKLSNYTSYEAHKFPLNKLVEWRKLTSICIEKMIKFTVKE